MDDNEINEIREKRMKELKEKMEHQDTTGSVIQVDQLHISDILQKHPLLSSISGLSGAGRAGGLAPHRGTCAGVCRKGHVCEMQHRRKPAVALQLNISAIPNIVFFSHGKMVDRVIGAYPEGSDPGKSAPEFPVTGKNQECACEKIFFYRLFAVGIVCPLFVDFLCRPAAAVVAGPVRLAPGLCMFFLILCRIEVLTGRLRRPLLLRRAGLRVVGSGL